MPATKLTYISEIQIFLGYTKLINETRLATTKPTQIDVYAEQLATQTLMSSKDLMVSTIYINSLIERVEKSFFLKYE